MTMTTRPASGNFQKSLRFLSPGTPIGLMIWISIAAITKTMKTFIKPAPFTATG